MTTPVFLFTDLDRTLLPNGAAEESAGARDMLNQLVSQGLVRLHFVTGRDLGRAESAIAEYGLPQPEGIIADVGTTIYQPAGSDWIACPRWQARILEDWAGERPSRLAATLGDLPQLRLQEPDRQGPAKLSFYTAGDGDPVELRQAIDSRLAPLGVNTRIVWSLDESTGVGLVDLMPASASKRLAIEFVLERDRIPAARTVFAGDSGNDLEVLISPLLSILVANASDEVRAAALEGAAAAGQIETLYIARGGFLGFNGNYCGGILEGLCTWVPALAPVLREKQQSMPGGE